MRRRLRAVLAAGLAALASFAASAADGWFADPKTGCRLWYPSADASLIVRWDGSCVNGLASGLGTFEFLARNGKSAAKGEAEFRDGKRDGRGFVVRADGVRVEAEYRAGFGTGRAVELFPSGDRYVGGYVDGVKSGHGIYTWASGLRYEGEWANDERHGKGIFTGRGDRYEGEWKNEKRDGRGVYLWSDGERYEGEWREGRPDGNGTFRGKDMNSGTNKVWTGVWHNGCFSNGRDKVSLIATRKECGFE